MTGADPSRLSPAEVVEAIRTRGWKQGAILSVDVHVFAFDTSSHGHKRAAGALREFEQARKTEARWREELRRDPISADPPSFLPAMEGTGDVNPGGGSLSIIISQTCDVLADLSKEPWIEVMRVSVKDQKIVDIGEENSIRWFTLDRERRLVAEATRRTRLDKGVLVTRDPVEFLPKSGVRQGRFVDWLALRYARPALPDDLDQEFRTRLESLLVPAGWAPGQPVLPGCSEVRYQMRKPPTGSKYGMALLFLTWTQKERDGIKGAVQDLVDQLSASLDPKVVKVVAADVSHYGEVYTSDYLSTRRFTLEAHNYYGDEVTGTLPPAS